MKRLPGSALYALAALAVSACAVFTSPDDPARQRQYVSLVTSLTWDDPVTGKRDGARTSWPLTTVQRDTETFPLAQIRQCDPAACAWGVLRAQRSVRRYDYLPGGVTLALELALDIDRSQAEHKPGLDAVLTVPADVPALRARQRVQRVLTLQYGQVQQIALDYGVRFAVCALRYDAAGRALDVCEIPYI